MLLDCGAGENSWESLGLLGNHTSQSWMKSVLNIHWKDWCWSWNANPLATWCKVLTHWKRPWCSEGLGAGGKRDDLRMRWLDSITDPMDMGYSRFRELVMDREAWRATVHIVVGNQMPLSNWTELNPRVFFDSLSLLQIIWGGLENSNCYACSFSH